MKIMSVIKLVPFYLFLTYNILLSLLFLITYPGDMISDQMPWNAEGLGWAYENRVNYTIMTLSDVIVLVFSSVYAWRKRNESLVKAYIAVSIYISIFLIKYVYYRYFYF